MASISNLHLSLIISLISIASATFFISLVQASDLDFHFTASLIHRDSPISPLYNPKDTHFDRLHKSFHRSISRANRLSPNPNSTKAIQSDISSGAGEYLVSFFVGTPKTEVLAIADTGSDLIWIQCQPCELCYKQNSPIFNPRRSSTYQNVLCGTKFCNKLDPRARLCSARGFVKTCDYSYSYGDNSFSDGHLSIERFVIGSNSSNTSSPVYLQQIIFGCGTRNGGLFDESESGVVGLGRGSLSLISQLGTKIRGKFSYCLVPISAESNYSTSKISFGPEMLISGSDTVSTPLVSKKPDTFYYLTLEAISVGNKKLPYTKSWTGDNEKGNIIIDSGTTLTFLDSEFFDQLESALEEAVKAERVSDPSGVLRICFRIVEGVELPVITAHFTDAEVKLQTINTFAKVEDDLMCFTMIPSNDISIFGNLAQIDFLVGYDLEENTVSFRPNNCAKL